MNGDAKDWIVKLTDRINVLTSRSDDLELVNMVLKSEIEILQHRLNNAEVLLDNLRVQCKHHSHNED